MSYTNYYCISFYMIKILNILLANRKLVIVNSLKYFKTLTSYYKNEEIVLIDNLSPYFFSYRLIVRSVTLK